MHWFKAVVSVRL